MCLTGNKPSNIAMLVYSNTSAGSSKCLSDTNFYNKSIGCFDLPALDSTLYSKLIATIPSLSLS